MASTLRIGRRPFRTASLPCVNATGGPTGNTPPFTPAQCASPLHKDSLVEIDWVQHHSPNLASVADVVAAFDTAPVTNPDATLGIRLHVHIDEQVALHADAQRIALTPCTGLATSTGDADFDTLKDAKFGTPDDRANLNRLNARNWAYHYGIWAHNQTPIPPSATNTSSGCAEQPGNDFIVTMGSWTPDTTLNTTTGHTGGVGSRSEQAGTFMHELGHNLNLRHGGGDPRPASQVLLELNKPYVDTNCKPNYMSVMNYTYQVANTVADRLLSYSSAKLLTLSEGDSTRAARVLDSMCPGGALTCSIAFGPLSGFPAKPTLVSALGGISWNPPDADILDLNIKRDLNNITSASGACPASGGTNPTDILDGFNDWANIQLNFRASTDFAGGVGLTFETDKKHGNEELTREEHLTISRDVCDIKSADKKNNQHPDQQSRLQCDVLQPERQRDCRRCDTPRQDHAHAGRIRWDLEPGRDYQQVFQQGRESRWSAGLGVPVRRTAGDERHARGGGVHRDNSGARLPPQRVRLRRSSSVQ